MRWVRIIPLAFVTTCFGVGIAMVRHSPDFLDPSIAWQTPSWNHPLGCGEAGVDLLALVSHAGAHGLVLAVSVALLGFVVGTPLGASAGLLGGRAERWTASLCDLTQAFPTILLALAVLSAVRSPSRLHLAAVFTLTAWAPFARLALAQTRVLRGAAYIQAAAALGARRPSVLFHHLIPNLLGLVAIQLGASAGALVVSEAALSFIGLGPRDGVSLGAVIDQGVLAMLRAPHVLLVGALSIFATSVSLIVAGRAVEDRKKSIFG